MMKALSAAIASLAAALVLNAVAQAPAVKPEDAARAAAKAATDAANSATAAANAAVNAANAASAAARAGNDATATNAALNAADAANAAAKAANDAARIANEAAKAVVVAAPPVAAPPSAPVVIAPPPPPPAPAPSGSMTGIVKFFEPQGGGFITPDGGGKDLHVDLSQVVGGLAAGLKPGQKVTFNLAQGPKGPAPQDVRIVAQPPAPPPPPKAPGGTTNRVGTVKYFNDAKGYGYITPDDGSAEVFAHFSAINMSGFKTLKEGQKVIYDVVSGPKGLQASNIRKGG
jgi:cold shock protein